MNFPFLMEQGKKKCRNQGENFLDVLTYSSCSDSFLDYGQIWCYTGMLVSFGRSFEEQLWLEDTVSRDCFWNPLKLWSWKLMIGADCFSSFSESVSLATLNSVVIQDFICILLSGFCFMQHKIVLAETTVQPFLFLRFCSLPHYSQSKKELRSQMTVNVLVSNFSVYHKKTSSYTDSRLLINCVYRFKKSLNLHSLGCLFKKRMKNVR